MESYVAISEAVNGKVKEISKHLRLSGSSLYKWMEPSSDYSDSGSLNPLDRLEGIIEKALMLGHPVKKALAPVYYLARKFNLVVIPLSQQEASTDTISADMLKIIKEFGELALAHSQGIEDGVIEQKEAENIKKEGWEVINQVAVYLQKVEVYKNGNRNDD